MKRTAILLAVLALTACNRIEEWHPKPDPKAEAEAKSREAAMKRVTPKMASDYYSQMAKDEPLTPVDGMRRGALPPTSGSRSAELTTDKPTENTTDPRILRERGLVARAEAEKRKALVAATQEAEKRNTEARLAAQAKTASSQNKGDITLPARPQ